jgi:hypothetical protein
VGAATTAAGTGFTALAYLPAAAGRTNSSARTERAYALDALRRLAL